MSRRLPIGLGIEKLSCVSSSGRDAKPTLAAKLAVVEGTASAQRHAEQHGDAGVAADLGGERPAVADLDVLLEVAAEGDEDALRRQQRRDVGERQQQRLGGLGFALELGVLRVEGERHHLVGDDVGGARRRRRVDVEPGGVPAGEHVAGDVLPLAR